MQELSDGAYLHLEMASSEQFAQRTFADETKLITGNAVEWQDPAEIRLEKVQSDGLLVVREPGRLDHLPAPWPEAQTHGEIMLELKLAGNHLDREQVERALLRRQARQVQRVTEQEVVWFGEEPLWVVAPHLPGWLCDMRKPTSPASGCYWIEPQWQRFLWIAANELPLRDELIPFLLARSGQKLDEFAKWAADRRPLDWTMNMLEYLPMSTMTQEELLARFDPADDPELRARRQRILERVFERDPQIKERLTRQACEEAREEGREEGRIHTLRDVLRNVLESRRLMPEERNDARILTCSDAATLERWLARALTAHSLADVLD